METIETGVVLSQPTMPNKDFTTIELGKTEEPDRPHFAEIDGLRAIAVILVILYHARMGIRGGFVGVDVFFVISGFLITRMMVHDQNSGQFSLAGFWTRRVRRIIPASVCMTAVTLVFGSAWLLPDEFKNLATSAIWQQFGCSNVYFWSIGGYFDGPLIPKPLLHTWSLSIEEQFYLASPIVLLLVRRLSRPTTIVMCGVIGVASFIIAEYLLAAHSTAAFYGLLSRLWEFLLGSLCFIAVPWRSLQPVTRSVIGWIGGAAILIPSLVYSDATRFPGAAAVPPCVGAALFIWSNRTSSIGLGRLLAYRPIVIVGLMSYSLYLWHWPIFVFYRQRFGFERIEDRSIAIAMTFLVAYGSWKYIELPFRERRFLTNGRALVLSHFGAVSAITIACLITSVPKSIRQSVVDLPRGPDRSNSDLVALDTNFSLPPNVRIIGAQHGLDDPVRFLVWGDSHAMAAALTVESLARRFNLRGAFAARSGFIPLLEAWNESPNTEGREEQLRWGRNVAAFAVEHHIPVVILIVRWDCKLGGPEEPYKADPPVFIRDEHTSQSAVVDAQRVFHDGLLATVSELQKYGAMVWLVRQPPVQINTVVEDVNRASSLKMKYEFRGVSRGEYASQQKNFEDALAKCSDIQLQILGPADALFDNQGFTRITDGRLPWYWDDDHLNELGAEQLIRPLLEPLFASMASTTRQSTATAAQSKGQRR